MIRDGISSPSLRVAVILWNWLIIKTKLYTHSLCGISSSCSASTSIVIASTSKITDSVAAINTCRHIFYALALFFCGWLFVYVIYIDVFFFIFGIYSRTFFSRYTNTHDDSLVNFTIYHYTTIHAHNYCLARTYDTFDLLLTLINYQYYNLAECEELCFVDAIGVYSKTRSTFV